MAAKLKLVVPGTRKPITLGNAAASVAPEPTTSLDDVFALLQRYATERRAWRTRSPGTDADRVALRDLVLVITTALEGGGWSAVHRAADAAKAKPTGSDEKRAAVVATIEWWLRGWKAIAIPIRKRGESRASFEGRLEKRCVAEAEQADLIVTWLAQNEPAFAALSPRVVVETLFRRRGSKRAYGIAATLSVAVRAFGDTYVAKARAAFKRATERRRAKKSKATK